MLHFVIMKRPHVTHFSSKTASPQNREAMTPAALVFPKSIKKYSLRNYIFLLEEFKNQATDTCFNYTAMFLLFYFHEYKFIKNETVFSSVAYSKRQVQAFEQISKVNPT
jgi:hypothetical protein